MAVSSSSSTGTGATIFSLPNEVLLHIASYLDPLPKKANEACSYRDTAALALVCRRFNNVYDRVLYELQARATIPLAVWWAAENNQLNTLKKALAARSPAHPLKRFSFEEATNRILILSMENDRRSRVSGRAYQPDAVLFNHQSAITLDPFYDSDDSSGESPDGDSDNDNGEEEGEEEEEEEYDDNDGDDDDDDDGSDDGDSDEESVDEGDEEDGDAEDYNEIEGEGGENHSTNDEEDRLAENTWGGPRPFYHGPIHVAISKGHTQIVQALLDSGAPVNATSRFFCDCRHLEIIEQTSASVMNPPWTILHTAICGNHTEMAKYLLARGASEYLESSEKIGVTALHFAALRGNMDIVRHLIESKIQTDIDVRDERGQTPFAYAFKENRWHTVMPFLKGLGADINVGLGEGYSPLLFAIRRKDFQNAIDLLNMGADATIRCGVEASGAVHLSCFANLGPNGRRKLVDELLAPLRRRLVAQLIACGADVNAQEISGLTPLHYAVIGHQTEVIDLLIDAGADTNTVAQDERASVLMWAAADGTNPALAKLLLDRGASVHKRSKDGSQALHWACNHRQFLHQGLDAYGTRREIVELLLARGADPNVRAPYPRGSGTPMLTPLRLAADWAHYKKSHREALRVCQTLLANGAAVSEHDMEAMFKLAVEAADEQLYDFVVSIPIHRFHVGSPRFADVFKVIPKVISPSGLLSGPDVVQSLLQFGIDRPRLKTDVIALFHLVFVRGLNATRVRLARRLIEVQQAIIQLPADSSLPLVLDLRHFWARLYEMALFLFDNISGVDCPSAEHSGPMAHLSFNLQNTLNADDRREPLPALLVSLRLLQRDAPPAFRGLYLQSIFRLAVPPRRDASDSREWAMADLPKVSELCNLLLQCGEDPNIQDYDGDNSLCCFLRYANKSALSREWSTSTRVNDIVTIVFSLVGCGADPNLRNNDGKAAVDYLCNMIQYVSTDSQWGYRGWALRSSMAVTRTDGADRITFSRKPFDLPSPRLWPNPRKLPALEVVRERMQRFWDDPSTYTTLSMQTVGPPTPRDFL
jgi:ankyrin repeat protein